MECSTVIKNSSSGMSYIRGACGVSAWNGENNESVHEWFGNGMGAPARGVECGVRVREVWCTEMVWTPD